jgi:hypothetical protein
MIEQFPVVIFDKEFHKDLVEHIEVMKAKGTISPDDDRLFLVTDSIDEAVDFIRNNTIKKFNLRPETPYKPFRWLLERK